ncbi:hypothetical protein F4677DRAFT_425067 [Hypoxylon crocopeplum]|nr:hypothetical protein F4677DRAFT_425067 [Hypoxylon crocopeplum]
MPLDDDIAVVGVAFRLPQGVEDEDALWSILQDRINLMTTWPDSRATIDSFYDSSGAKLNRVHSRGGYFLRGDPAVFDASFFAISENEAAAMDPQQRWALETSYHALENAGIQVEKLKGSQTSVFSSSFSDDYARVAARDPDSFPRTSVTGTAPSVLANRVSWYFDFRGPSVHVDTACSSTLVAVDLACQSIRSGTASTSLVIGTSLILSPERSVLLDNRGLLSADGKCYSFDHRANGYARGEGVIVLVLKPISQALQDGDIIRAVIRSTCTNSDGRTSGLTRPNPDAQAELIRKAYEKAGIGFSATRYFEAHGTGTRVGDPIEMEAIGRVFGSSRRSRDPLYVGSIKANIGHLEGCSGLAGILKCLMVLERGIIPPNALFEKINPDIDLTLHHTAIPTQSLPWPTNGLRRVSVNSFGFGGANAHVIMDDSYHYIQTRDLRALVNSSRLPRAQYTVSLDNTNAILENAVANGVSLEKAKVPKQTLHLLVWSAPDEKSLHRVVQGYNDYHQSRASRGKPTELNDLAFTLAARRSQMPCRAFSVVDAHFTGCFSIAEPTYSSAGAAPAFVFTGQGAQYAKMGLELVQYPIFRKVLQEIDLEYAVLGCKWSIFDELQKPETIDQPEYSQPLCTALQIALVELLQSFGLRPSAVVGHSSGEIAAAYAIGALSLSSACKIAYFRGQVAAKLRARTRSSPGAMLSVNLSKDRVWEFLRDEKLHGIQESVQIACFNSPINLTLSGSEENIDKIKATLDRTGIFAQKLWTGIAYHSAAMRSVSFEYLVALGSLDHTGSRDQDSSIPMLSSVTGEVVTATTLRTPQYWVGNMISPVQFSETMHSLGKLLSISDIVEIGPHSTLRRSIQDSLGQSRDMRYHSILSRSKPALPAALDTLGRLFCHGHRISITAVNQQGQDANRRSFHIDCPRYPFDHSKRYWAESRLSRAYRLRSIEATAAGNLLGLPVTDWNPLEPRWRQMWTVDSSPWLADHVVCGNMLLPGAAMLVMALEAVGYIYAKQKEAIEGFHIKEASFLEPVVIPEFSSGEHVETELHLHRIQKPYEKESVWSEVKIFVRAGDEVSQCFHAKIKIQSREATGDPISLQGALDKQVDARDAYKMYKTSSRAVMTASADMIGFYETCINQGLQYGKHFRLVDSISWYADGTAIGQIALSEEHNTTPTTMVMHPAVVDAVLQLIAVQTPSSRSRATATYVPFQLSECWISATGWCQEAQTTPPRLRYLTGSQRKPQGMEVDGTITVMGNDEDSVLIHCKKLIFKPISRTVKESGSKTDPMALYGISWKPQLSLLSAKELRQVIQADHGYDYNGDENGETIVAAIEDYHLQLDETLDLVVRSTLEWLTNQEELDKTVPPGHLRDFVLWMQQRQEASNTFRPEGRDTATIDEEHLEASLQRLERILDSHLPASSLKVALLLARHIKSILSGAIDPYLLIAGEEELQQEFLPSENSLPDTNENNPLHSLLSLMSHEKPNQKVLSLGGDSAVDLAQEVLSTLVNFEARNYGNSAGCHAFGKFTCTDVDESVVEKVKERMALFSDDDRSEVRVVGNGIQQQQGEEITSSYDLVLVSGCFGGRGEDEELRRAVLQNAHASLRPGGYLLHAEEMTTTEPVRDSLVDSFVTGLVPRYREGCLPWQQQQQKSAGWVKFNWDNAVLKNNGFTGIELALRNHRLSCDGSIRVFNLILSRAVVIGGDEKGESEQSLLPTSAHVVIVVRSLGSQLHVSMAGRLEEEFLKPSGYSVTTVSFDDIRSSSTNAAAVIGEADVVISLLEAHEPLLPDLSPERFECLKVLVMVTRKRLLWLTATFSSVAGPCHEKPPYHATMEGLFRSVRSEAAEKQIVTLTVGPGKAPDTDSIGAYIGYLATVFRASFESLCPEVEYTVHQGRILTGRLYREKALERWLTHPADGGAPTSVTAPWRQQPPVRLAIDTPGLLDTLYFSEDSAPPDELAPEEVEIEARAWGVAFRDVFVALGRLGDNDFGIDCAGVVTRVGSAGSDTIQPGDRVAMCSLGGMRTFPRAHYKAVAKIGNAVDFETAASVVNPGMTAYYCLVEVARLGPGDRVLIHSGSGSTGQLAIWIAKMVGAEVFATVGLPDKKRLLMEQFGVPEDHIFSSRSTNFAQGIMRVTQGAGLDVVLNSLAGDALVASLDCVAPFGRFVEIGKADIMANSGLPMAALAKNISFCVVDLHHLARTNVNLLGRVMTKTMELVTKGHIQCPKPLHVYPPAEIEAAFRYMQSGKNTGRVVINLGPEDVIERRLDPRGEWKLEGRAIYLVAGGFGGLGRAILQWLVDRGARNLLVLSRSGPSSQAAADLVARFREQGVCVVAPCCDAASSSALSAALKSAYDQVKAPIKGCINASMVLQDAVFDNMRHLQWSQTIRSKVDVSWNLHNQLPAGLDFFVQLSSLSGIYGSLGQSNYAAGCAFQDALARHRVAQGEKAVSLDLGWMHDAGVIAANKAYQRHREQVGDMHKVSTAQLLSVLDAICDPSRPVATSQLLVGLVTPAEQMAQGHSSPSSAQQRPLFAGFTRVKAAADGGDGGEADVSNPSMDTRNQNPAAQFKQESTSEGRAAVVVEALRHKLARALALALDDMSVDDPLADYGVDSLVAVELRNWVRTLFEADLPVSDFTSRDAAMSTVGQLVVKKSQLAAR